MAGIATGRLTEERKSWRKDHPPGFFAKPMTKPDGSSDLFLWNCGVPGKAGTDWEGGVYKVTLQFTEDYPSKPPIAKFTPAIFHPNVFSSGQVCLSILKEQSGWRKYYHNIFTRIFLYYCHVFSSFHSIQYISSIVTMTIPLIDCH